MNHGTITLWLKHYAKDSFQDHQFFVVETPTRKEIIIGHPASVRLGLIQVLCKNHAKTVSSIETNQTNNLSQVHHIDGKTSMQKEAKRSSSEPKSSRKSNNKSFQDPLSRPQSITGQNMNERTKTGSFQDPKCQTEHAYGKNDWHWSKSRSFQDHHPWQHSRKNDKTSSFQDPNWQVLKRNKISSFQDLLSRPLREPMVCMVNLAHFKTLFQDPGYRALHKESNNSILNIK